MGGSSKSTVVGYKYLLGMHVVLGHPVDYVKRIIFADRKAWEGNVSSGEIFVNKLGLFGGESREGGVHGIVRVLDGNASQGQDPYLQSFLGQVIPAFRGVCSLVFESFYFGTNPYIKALAVQVVRTQTKTNGSPQWDITNADIDEALNPSHLIRETLTSTQWGMGYPEGTVDEATFLEASATLKAESFGLSMMWNESSSIEDFLREVVNHIDAKVSVSPITGKWALSLIRKDYVVANILALDPSNIVSLDSFSRLAIGETINEVSVIYRDHEDNKDKTITVQNLGNIQMQGAVVPFKVHYPGIPTAELAMRVAQRDLLARSTPLTKVKLSVNRTAAGISIGDVFKLTWPKLGLVDLVFRVGKVEAGTINDGTITLVAVEDVFGLADVTYAGQQPTGWTDPTSIPLDLTKRALVEAPYWDVNMDPTTTPDSYDPDFGFIQTLAVRTAGDAFKYDVFTAAPGATYVDTGDGNFAPSALLVGDIKYTETVLTYTDSDLISEVKIGDHAYIGDEMVNLISLDSVNKTFVVDRAILDTVPVPHAAQERIWFSGGNFGSDTTERVEAEEVRVKLLPITPNGQLEESEATYDTIILNNRYQRPYPPGKYRLNTVEYPELVIDSELTFTWAHRDRTQQLAYFNTQSEGNIGPEVGTTYEFTLTTLDLTVIHSETGLTGTSLVVTPISVEGTVIATISSAVGGLLCTQGLSHTFLYLPRYTPSTDFVVDSATGYTPSSDFNLGA